MVFWNVIAFGKSSKHLFKFSSTSHESQSFVHRGLYLGLEVLHLFYTEQNSEQRAKMKSKIQNVLREHASFNLMYQYLFFRLWEAHSVNFLLHEQLLLLIPNLEKTHIILKLLSMLSRAQKIIFFVCHACICSGNIIDDYQSKCMQYFILCFV